MKRELKNLALAFSSANLCLLAVWRRLILATSTDKFLAPHHTSNDFLSILLCFAVPLFRILACTAVGHLFTTSTAVSAAGRIPGRSLKVEHTGPRVVWLAFDEMDQRLTFAQRPPNLQLPELDHLRRESLYGSNVHSPGRETLLCLPSLITGKVATRYKPVRSNELMLTFKDEQQPVRWSTQPNLFTAAGEAGLSTALVGWYLPYCRV